MLYIQKKKIIHLIQFELYKPIISEDFLFIEIYHPMFFTYVSQILLIHQ